MPCAEYLAPREGSSGWPVLTPSPPAVSSEEMDDGVMGSCDKTADFGSNGEELSSFFAAEVEEPLAGMSSAKGFPGLEAWGGGKGGSAAFVCDARRGS